MFKRRPSAQPFLWKWGLFAWEWNIISILKVEHLTSFWYRGPGELGNGLLVPPSFRVSNRTLLCATLPWVSRLLKIINLVHLSQFLFQGIFQEVGEFIIDSFGKQKLVLSNELIIWPDNSTAPSSEVRKCRSCKDRCYNGKKFSQQLNQSDFWTVYSIISWDIIQIKSYFVETVGGGGGGGVEIQEMIWNIPWYNMTNRTIRSLLFNFDRANRI